MIRLITGLDKNVGASCTMSLLPFQMRGYGHRVKYDLHCHISLRKNTLQYKLGSGIWDEDINGFVNGIIDCLIPFIKIENQKAIINEIKKIKQERNQFVRESYIQEGYTTLAKEETDDLYKSLYDLKVKIRNPEFRAKMNKIDPDKELVNGEESMEALLAFAEVDRIQRKLKDLVKSIEEA